MFLYRFDDRIILLKWPSLLRAEVALAIAKEFPELISSRNAHGDSPLQIMASFFRKTEIFNSLIYEGKGRGKAHLTLNTFFTFFYISIGLV